MGNAVIAGVKKKEVKSKIDPVGVMEVAINRGERIMGAYPFPY